MRGLVQLLSDAGWPVRAVLPSKYNGYFRETGRAAFIETDKGGRYGPEATDAAFGEMISLYRRACLG